MIKKLLAGLLGLIAIVTIGLLVVIQAGNPEALELDDAARAKAPGAFVELSGGITHYDVAGPEDAQVVILVHGFSVPFYIWDTTFAALSNSGFRVIRYDTFGRGYSDRPDVAYDGAFFERQITDLIDALALTVPVDVIGLSMGGGITSRFAANNPERVRRLVFVDPTNQSWGEPAFPRPLGAIIMALRAFPVMAEGQMTDFLHPENYPTWVEQYRVQMQYKGFRNAIVSTIYDYGPDDHLANFARLQRTDIPVLLIWGLQDRTVPVAGAERIQNVLDVEYLPVDDSGHLPHIEQAESVNGAIVEFLSAARE